MITEDNLYTGEEARKRIMSGVSKAAEAVGITLGTAGSNSLIECIEAPQHFSTNDGATILGSLCFADPLEEMGRKILCESVSKANRQSGDGSSTTTVLTASILEEGMRYLSTSNPMDVKRSLEKCIPLIEEGIKSQVKEITVDSVQAVATISAEDKSIGSMIQEIYQKIGKEGIVQWDISKTTEDYYEIGNGLTIAGATYVTPYMCDREEKTGYMTNSIRLKDVPILLTKQKITTSVDIDKLSAELFGNEQRELVIFCEEIEPQAISEFLQARQQLGFRIIVVKMPVLWRDEWWEDLAATSGATIVGGNSGIKLRYATKNHLGTFQHVTINKEDTIVEGIKDISHHLMALKVDGSDQALQRVERLNTKSARYFVGAHSESSLAYRRLKVEDAINAASCALEHGIVVGGGRALINCIEKLPLSTVGGKILEVALGKPMAKIAENCGILEVSLENTPSTYGLNSKTGKVEDLMKANIVDPADVVLNAIRNAIGVAASILTVGTVVTLPKENNSVVMSPMVQR